MRGDPAVMAVLTRIQMIGKMLAVLVDATGVFFYDFCCGINHIDTILLKNCSYGLRIPIFKVMIIGVDTVREGRRNKIK